MHTELLMNEMRRNDDSMKTNAGAKNFQTALK
jgi:hypothetical protein